MLVLERSFPANSRPWARGLGVATALAALTAAGCSANITRFDNPSFALSDGSTTSVAKRSGGAPVFDDGPTPVATPASTSPPTPASRPVTVAALPVAAPPPAPAASPAPSRAPAPIAAPAAPAAQPRPLAKGETIDVQQGDTLYGIAKRHHVMISELMAVNDLKSPTIKPGQRLYLPAKTGTAAGPRPPLQRVASAAPAAVQVAPAAAPAPASASDWNGSHQVKPGESLYGIARQYSVRSDELQRVNGIVDAQKVRPGTMLKVPGERTAAASPATPESAAPVQASVPAATSGARSGVNIINGAPPAEPNQQVAATEPVEQQAATKAPATSFKLRWPVTGRVVQKFGPRTDGSQSDGIDVAVPFGTDVLAAETGTVAYAGNEVKAYGNLVLVRHDNGWVTAYAYNDQILVQRGDRVKRGQPIAKAGKSGAVDQPQLHFEVRVGAKPVDPLPLMEKL